jgi:hypothetical protein
MRKPSSHLFIASWLWVLALLVSVAASPIDEPNPTAAGRVQDLIDTLKTQLGIDVRVVTAIVPTNPLLVSVQPVDSPSAASEFVMSFEERFLTGVDDEELRAIIAHELGHVWIFTHHPYLQTERLANTVAMRAVSRASLERVYIKVWEREGTKGDLTRFLGQ